METSCQFGKLPKRFLLAVSRDLKGGRKNISRHQRPSRYNERSKKLERCKEFTKFVTFCRNAVNSLSQKQASLCLEVDYR